MTNSIFIVPSLAAFASSFAKRLTPPYSEADASTNAEISVLNNVRMAYFNGDQIPIHSGTSAEAAVAHLIKATALDLAVVGRAVRSAFVGHESLRDQSEVASGEFHSPFLLIEEHNDFDIGVYGLNVAELSRSIDSELFDTLDAEYSDAVVISLSEPETEVDAALSDAYTESLG